MEARALRGNVEPSALKLTVHLHPQKIPLKKSELHNTCFSGETRRVRKANQLQNETGTGSDRR